MKKRKKKHYTTKHTHIRVRKRVQEDKDWTPRTTPKEKMYENIIGWSVIICLLAHILLKACNNDTVGYDHFPHIPSEWIRVLK